MDPPKRQQPAITPRHLRHLARLGEITPTIQPLADRAIGAWFFALRSCEYLRVTGERKTLPLRLTDITFLSRSKEILHNTDPNLPTRAYYVQLTFRDQKNNSKFETRTQQRVLDAHLDPVTCWVRIVQSLLPLCTHDDPNPLVSCLQQPSTHTSSHVTSADLLCLLRSTGKTLGQATLGYDPITLGTHSIRSGAAMALFLACPDCTKIQILGRWKSQAFMDYIRQQIVECTATLSNLMVKTKHFTHSPTKSSSPSSNNGPSTTTSFFTPSLHH